MFQNFTKLQTYLQVISLSVSLGAQVAGMDFPIANVRVDVLSHVFLQITLLGEALAAIGTTEWTHSLMHPEVIEEVRSLHELLLAILMATNDYSPRSGGGPDRVIPQGVGAVFQDLQFGICFLGMGLLPDTSDSIHFFALSLFFFGLVLPDHSLKNYRD